MIKFDLSTKSLIKTFIGFILSFYFITIFYQDFLVKVDFKYLDKINFNIFLLSFFSFMFAYFVRAIRWNIMINLKNISHLNHYLRSCIFNSFLPFRAGDLYRIYYVHNVLKIKGSLKLIIIERFIDLLIVLNLFLIFNLNLWYMSFLFIIFFTLVKFNGFCKFFNFDYTKFLLLSLLTWVLELIGYFFSSYAVLNIFPSLHIFDLMPIGTLSTLIPSAPGAIGTFEYFLSNTLYYLNYSKIDISFITIIIHLQLIFAPVLMFILFLLLKIRFINKL